MDIVLDNRVLSGKMVTKPVFEDVKRHLICALLCEKESRISNILVDKETKEFIELIETMGAKVRIEEYKGKRKTLYITGAFPFDTEKDCIEFDRISILRLFSPLLLLSKKKLTFKYYNYNVTNGINSNYSLFYKYGFTEEQKAENQYPIKIKNGFDESIFYIRGDVREEYLSTLIMVLPKLYRSSKIRIIGEIENKQYIKRTLEILKKFEVDVRNNNFESFDLINLKYEPCNAIIENNYTSAALWLTASALGHKVMLKNLNLKSKQTDKKLIDILKLININLLTNKHGDIITTPNEINAFNIDISKVPNLLPYLAAIATVADGTSKLKNAGKIMSGDYNVADELVNAINQIGGDSFVFGGDLIIKGKNMLKGGKVQNVNIHEVVFALCTLSRQAVNPITVEIPKTMPKYYKEFYRDFTRLGGKNFL